jgi:acyl transferase domain-containing protein
MGKRVFMFPGQGSQYIGMGKEFYDTMPNAKAVIDLASEQTGLDIPALCFEENDKLNITEYTQICIQIKNSYEQPVVFADDIPISRSVNHGIGVQSMISVVEKYHGVYGFFADHGEFRFQASM